MPYFEPLAVVLLAVISICVFAILSRRPGQVTGVDQVRRDIERSDKLTREEADRTRHRFGETSEIITMRLNQFERATVEAHRAFADSLTKELKTLVGSNEEKAEKLREQVATSLEKMREENQVKLDQIKKTVDEQLQTTLEKGLQERFALIGEHLQSVAGTLVEMQQLASGVGELKRVLSHVRPRGVWGELQLESLLSDFLAADQYRKNAKPDPLQDRMVEFAIVLPSSTSPTGEVLLPIDAKFPRDAFDRLVEASNSADPAAVKAESETLAKAVKTCAKEIKEKYINPPYTTDYAVMFLPSEGLYAEVARHGGLLDQIVRECGVMVAGPSTLAALLNALRVGFGSLAIQRHASQITQVLQTVRHEFEKYDKVVASALKKATGTVNTLDKLQVRQRVMGSALKGVELLKAESPDDVA
ncbi:MAG TPA: DNA recombination protein RmuC, partial [Candidatus Binatia bacterium]|nr:DNA recombination protein RmuC [Candidatus Binatia bacterium]